MTPHALGASKCDRNKDRKKGRLTKDGYEPFPVRATFCGLPPPSSVMLSVAARNPLADGVKVTVMVHEPPGGIEPALTQVLDSL